MTGLGIAVVAAAAMVVTDIVSVVQVQAENRERGWLAGWMDVVGWLVAITTTTISVSALQGHSLTEKVWVVALVSAANLGGTKLGQMIGKRWVKDAGTLAQRVTAIEKQVGLR